MIIAESLSPINGAVYKFGSNSYKWVYASVISFAKGYLHRNPDKIIIRFQFSNGDYLSIMPESITVISDGRICYIKRR